MDSRAQAIQVTDPQEPDTLARIAGKDMYGTAVGSLRRVELWRLGNLWGMKFPVGASKDFMLPFFMQLEAEGKNPMQPPGMRLEHTAQLRSRNVSYSGSHVEVFGEKPPEIREQDTDESFQEKLMKHHMWQLKKICKLRGIHQTNKDTKKELVARILSVSGDQSIEQDSP